MSLAKMTPEDRQDIKDGLYMLGTLGGVIARRTSTKVDDKIAKALVALASPENEKLFDMFLDIADKTVQK